MWNSVTDSEYSCSANSKYLIELHRVAALFAGLSRICALAELAIDHADVGVVDMAVDVEIGVIAVKPLPQDVRQAAELDQVVGSVKPNAVLKRQPVPTFDLIDIFSKSCMAKNYTANRDGAQSSSSGIVLLLSSSAATESAVIGASRMPLR